MFNHSALATNIELQRTINFPPIFLAAYIKDKSNRQATLLPIDIWRKEKGNEEIIEKDKIVALS